MTAWEKAAEWLLQQGWAGIVIILLGIAITWLVRQNQELTKQLTDSQNLRVQDAKEMTERALSVMSTVQGSVLVLTEIIRGLDRSRK